MDVGTADGNKSEGQGGHALRSRKIKTVQQAQRRGASLHGHAEEASGTVTYAGKMQAQPKPKETATTNPWQHALPKTLPAIIPIEDNSERSDSEEEEYH